MRKQVVLFTLLLLCIHARKWRPSMNLDLIGSDQPNSRRDINVIKPDHSDPADDIPDITQLRQARPQHTPEPPYRPIDTYNLQNSVKDKPPEPNAPDHMWFDFVAVHDRNLERPPLPRPRPRTRNPFDDVPPPQPISASSYFETNSFDLKRRLLDNFNKTRINRTTCEDLRRTAKYEPEDIINRDWIPFYCWMQFGGMRAFVHRFQYATEAAVRYYYTKYVNHLNNSVNWLESKLVLTEFNKEYLLIAGDRKGLYKMIPNMDLPEFVIKNNVTIHVPSIRLKIEDPYLILMYCERKSAYVMAQPGYLPRTKEDKTIEAEATGFIGKGQPLSRNRMYEMAMLKFMADKKRVYEARKHLPKNPDHGLFPPELMDPDLPDEAVFQDRDDE